MQATRPVLIRDFLIFQLKLVLDGFKGLVIAAFQFNADGKIVAALAALKVGFAGMPGALLERHVLHDPTIPPNECVGGNRELANIGEVGMRCCVEPVAEQSHLDRSAAQRTPVVVGVDRVETQRHRGASRILRDLGEDFPDEPSRPTTGSGAS